MATPDTILPNTTYKKCTWTSPSKTVPTLVELCLEWFGKVPPTAPRDLCNIPTKVCQSCGKLVYVLYFYYNYVDDVPIKLSECLHCKKARKTNGTV